MGVLDAAYQMLMTRNAVYVTFVIGGAYFGERAVTGTIDSVWNGYNKGKLWKEIEAKAKA